MSSRLEQPSLSPQTRVVMERSRTGVWEDVWKLRVPNRICHFIWLVKHGRIMCNSERKRGFTPDERCWIYRTAKEDVEYTIRRCPAAKAIWNRIVPETEERKSGVQWLERQFNEEIEAVSNGPRGGQMSINRRIFPWKPPDAGWVKVNTDRSSKGRSNQVACNGVIRDNNAEF
ncbi:PREDICTED: uncharacterized protein LOC109183339 [Ipomoea nil]|uniref:uncharacterized protein LOC109183339 n=1 Tax=Ipomoea nil TaxID=35883 RepID=UPI00090139F3|nr:PREDICTED: uncharacterized protein LOC109183339 [Ipomoea nil]